MASFDTTRPMADGRLFGARLSNLFSGLVGSFAAWNDARVTRKALASLTDRELDDLGLIRGDIDAIATGTYR